MLTFINTHVAFINYTPELFLSFSILAQLLLNTILRKRSPTSHSSLLEITFFQTSVILILTLFVLFSFNEFSISETFFHSKSTFILKTLIIIFSLLALTPISQGFYLQKLNYFEFYTLYLFSVLSSLLMISSLDFLTIYLLIEMQALCFYVMATFRRDSVFSAEAGMKYFIFGSIISCVFLFALSFLYGSVGTLNFNDLNLILFNIDYNIDEYIFLRYLINFSSTTVLLVLLFKLGVAPFHFWVPDVYEGAPISSTIIFSFLPKLVFFDLIIKIQHIFSYNEFFFSILFNFFGLSTLIIGAYFALYETRLKRFLIYSSISQIGFPIMVLGSYNTYYKSTVFFFLFFYLITSIMTWSFYLIIYTFLGKSTVTPQQRSPILLTDLSSLFYYDRIWATLCAIIFFSISGLPPFSGFLIKFIVLNDLVSSSLLTSVLPIFISSIPLFYYIRVIKLIFFENSLNIKLTPFSSSQPNLFFFYNLVVLLLCLSILVSILFFFDFWVLFSRYIYFSLYF